MNRGIKWDSEMECDMLSVLWKGVLLTHIARNNQTVVEKDGDGDSVKASLKEIAPWTEIVTYTVAE